MDEELQIRALDIAMGHPEVVGGDPEESWEKLWLVLGEELGWERVAKLDAAALRQQLGIAVQAERLRQKGLPDWMAEEKARRSAAKTPNELEHEIGVLRFLKPPERSRLQTEFDKNGPDALRAGLLRLDFWHGTDFDPHHRSQVPEPHTGDHITGLLRKSGAPMSCYMLVHSDREEFSRTLDLREAIDYASDGTVSALLSCLPGELAYFDGDWGDRGILHRRPLS
jgi:hypothetical protein